MKTSEFKIVKPEDVKSYMSRHNEKEYALIDVRQPAEYETGHIPGALLKPLNQLIQSYETLPRDKDLIFYCHVGSRSQMAAMMAAEEELFEKDLYSLDGGIMAWSGETLEHVPKVSVFDKAQTLAEFLQTAMNMEKGAERFYRRVVEQFQHDTFSRVFDQLAGVEVAHARILYQYYKNNTDPESSFEMFYEGLSGDMVEGGETLDVCIKRLSDIAERPCIPLLEFALSIEYSAYDLYRTLANQYADDAEMADAFFAIAQAEKSHMQMITEALDQC